MARLQNSANTSKKDCYSIVAKELSNFWIYGLNIYTITENNIARKIEKLHEDVRKLQKRPKAKEVELFNNKLLTGFDIKTNCKSRQKELEDEFNVKMGPEELALYEDNCKKKICKCSWNSPTKCELCPRQMVTTSKVDERWKSWYERKQRRKTTAENNPNNCNDFTTVEFSDETDDEYVPRPTKRNLQGDSTSSSPEFPEVPLRFSKKELNSNFMRVFIHLQSKYKVSERDLEGIVIDLSNMLFGQQYVASEQEIPIEDGDYESDEELSQTTLLKSKISTCPPLKRRRSHKDYSKIFPSRKCRRDWMNQAAILNLKYVADKLIHKGDDEVITWRFDDTVKSAGYRVHDIKTSNITMKNKDKQRETFTTGFSPNISRKGQDQSEAIKNDIEILATLAGCSTDEIFEHIDFWMSDRASECSTALDCLGIANDKRLKCCGHTILTIDEGIDYVFKEAEIMMGKDNLVAPEVGQKAFSSKTSLIVSGLIALAKALSPSHAQLSYSLYSLYKSWLTDNMEDQSQVTSFKGFRSNRFGRTSELAELFLLHKPHIIKFFEEVVDVTSNLLVSAVAAYIDSEWFEIGCKIFSKFRKVIIKPLVEILGIDKAKSINRPDRNWSGVKTFYLNKLEELEQLKVCGIDDSNVDKLVAKCASKVHENLTRQLQQMPFILEEEPAPSHANIDLAPLTNSGCESRMAELDRRLKVCGGSESIKSISNKQVVRVNRFLTTETAQDQPDELFKWARNSEEAKKVQQLKHEFLESVNMSKKLNIEAKKSAKIKNANKVLKLLDQCKIHGGPISPSNLGIIDLISPEQIILEARYLKATGVNDIKLKKREQTTAGKYKMVNLPIDVIKDEIKSTINPSKSQTVAIEMLLMKFTQQ